MCQEVPAPRDAGSTPRRPWSDASTAELVTGRAHAAPKPRGRTHMPQPLSVPAPCHGWDEGK
jgi:hypothetical protein